MLDNETKANIKYLTLLKQREQIEKELEEVKEMERESRTGITKENMEKLKDYFKD